jgi:hypothetical protein
VPHGTSPIIYIDGQQAQTQGYAQDANNYHIWYITHFSTHEVSIVFAVTPNSTYSPSQFQSFPQEVTYVAVAAVAIAVIVAVAVILRRSKKVKVERTSTTQ